MSHGPPGEPMKRARPASAWSQSAAFRWLGCASIALWALAWLAAPWRAAQTPARAAAFNPTQVVAGVAAAPAMAAAAVNPPDPPATSVVPAGATLMGTTLRGHVVVAGQSVPLPAGDWVALAFFRGGAGATKGDAAILGRLDGHRLSGMVAINAATFGARVTASSQPPFASCERTDYVARSRVVNEAGGDQRCWWINHATAIWQEQGPFRAAYQELAQRQVTPSQVLLNVGFRRADRDGFVTALYYFDPAEQGIGSAPLIWKASEWHKDRIQSDPARLRYVEDLRAWGESWAPRFFASR